jgi:hypothetical protein
MYIPFLPATAMCEPSLFEQNELIGPSNVMKDVLDGYPIRPIN